MPPRLPPLASLLFGDGDGGEFPSLPPPGTPQRPPRHRRPGPPLTGPALPLR